MLFQLLPDNLLVSMKEKMAMFIFLSLSQPCSQLVPRSKYLFSVLNVLHLSYAGFENLKTKSRHYLKASRYHLKVSDFVIALTRSHFQA